MKRTILFIIILIFVSSLGAGAVWYVYADPTKIHFYTRPIPITEYNNNYPPPPQHQPPIIPPGASTTTPPRLDQLPWGTRLSSKEKPLVSGVKWKTYSNIGYGFGVQYPEGWRIESYISNTDQIFFLSFFPPYATYDNLGIAIIHTNTGLIEYLEKYYGSLSDGYRGPAKKNITINNVNWTVEYPEQYDMQSDLYAENGGYIYRFSGTSFPTRNERNIIEYMIKSFYFLR